MKKIVLAACLFLSVFCTAQTESQNDQTAAQKVDAMMNMKIAMDIDQSVFTVNQGNTYITPDQTAGIVGMFTPQSYAKMKATLKDGKAGDMEIVDRGEMTLNGNNILFMKGHKLEDGQDFTMWVFCKENDANSCIMVNGFFETGKESTFKPQVEKAITSAKLIM